MKVLSGLGNDFKGGKRTIPIERIMSGASRVPGLFGEAVCDSREGGPMLYCIDGGPSCDQ